MNGEIEFGEFALQPASGVGEAMHAAGLDGRVAGRPAPRPVSDETRGPE